MACTSARYDGGAGAPHDQQALALQPPPAAANGARQAPIARKRPIELEAQNGRLLGVVPRTDTTTALPQRDVTRLLQAFMLPALPSAKRRPADAPTGDDPGAAERPHQSPVQSRAIMLKPTARQPPVIQITYGPPQDDLAERLQRMLQQALAQGLGPPMPRRPAVVARAIGTHPPPALPDRYAQSAKVGRVLGIITRQMDAVRKTIWSRWGDPPWTGGWQLLAAPTPQL